MFYSDSSNFRPVKNIITDKETPFLFYFFFLHTQVFLVQSDRFPIRGKNFYGKIWILLLPRLTAFQGNDFLYSDLQIS